MFVKKDKLIVLKDFNYNFSSKLESFSPNKNPFIFKIKELAKEIGVPDSFIKNTTIKTIGSEVHFHFYWGEEIESPMEDKEVIVAFLDDLPSIEKPNVLTEIYIKKNSGLLKTYVYGLDEFVNDFVLDDKAFKIEDENQFIDSLNVDFFGKFGKEIFILLSDYFDDCDENTISEFLKIKDVKSLLMSEDPQSISDTAPRETLIDLFRDYQKTA